MADQVDVTVRRDDAANRYEGRVGEDLAGLLTFVRTDGQIVFPHAETLPAYEGRGVGSAIVRHALDEARADGVAVVPRCPFVRSWIDRHPDYADLVAAAAQG